MLFDELSERFDPYTSEIIRQALTLEEFDHLEVEELVAYFELRAEQLYEQFRERREAPETHGRSPEEREEYLNILRRRWQQAEELAHIVATAEMAAKEADRARIA